MILEWMAYASASAALFGMAAACIERVSEARRAARRWIWCGAIIASTVVPIALPVLRAPNGGGAVSVNTIVIATAVAPPSARLDMLVLGAWAVVSFAFMTLLVVGQWRTVRILASCERGSIAGFDAFISRDFGPALVGALRPRIVVPAWALALDDNEQHLIVQHELEHARGRDQLLGLLGVTAVVAMPWNAAAWWQLSRLRLAVELDCDARVVARQHDDVVAYGQLLLRVRERGRTARQPSLALSHARSSLGRRLDALLQRHQARLGHLAAMTALGVSMIAAVGFVPSPRMAGVLSSLRRSPIGPDQAPMRPTRASASVISPRALATTPNAAGSASPRPARSVPPPAPRNATANRLVELDNAAVPPASVVPSNPLAQLSVNAASLPQTNRAVIRRAGTLVAAPTMSASAGSGHAFGQATNSPAGAVNAAPRSTAGGFVVRAVGGSAAAVRPDTSKPPAP